MLRAAQRSKVTSTKHRSKQNEGTAVSLFFSFSSVVNSVGDKKPMCIYVRATFATAQIENR